MGVLWSIVRFSGLQGCWLNGLGFWVLGFGFWVLGFRFRVFRGFRAVSKGVERVPYTLRWGAATALFAKLMRVQMSCGPPVGGRMLLATVID